MPGLEWLNLGMNIMRGICRKSDAPAVIITLWNVQMSIKSPPEGR